MDIPETYLVTDHQAFIRDILARHHITCETMNRLNQQVVEIQNVLNRKAQDMDTEKGCLKYSVKQRREEYALNQGDITVRLKQPTRRLIPLLLELRSSSALFTAPPYCQLLKIGQGFFIYRIPVGSTY